MASTYTSDNRKARPAPTSVPCPAMMPDSDFADGFTNRKAWTLYFSRQILKNTDINVTLFKSDRLERGPLFAESVAGSDRYRLQTDLQVKF